MSSSVYQLTVSPNRLDAAMTQILLTWQSSDCLLLLGNSILLAETILQNYPALAGHILLLSDDVQCHAANGSQLSQNLRVIANREWLALTQTANNVITLDFY